MKKSKRRSIIIIVIPALLLVVLGINFSALSHQDNTLNIVNPASIFLLPTPTPFPLPQHRYDTPSLITSIWSQLFGKKDTIVDPSKIIQKTKKRYENNVLDLYFKDDQFVLNEQWWQSESKEVYAYVSDNLDETYDGKVSVVVEKPLKENCSPRGKTIQRQEPIIIIYADNTTSKEQLLAVLAHELGHIFINKKYKNLSDVALNEGMATWAAGVYWKAWKGIDFDSNVKELLRKNAYLPLYQNYEMVKAFDIKNPDCIANRDQLLTEFASFLDYLIQEYGMNKLATLFEIRQPEIVNKQRIVYPPSYQDVYGLELNQLENNWLNHILGTSQ